MKKAVTIGMVVVGVLALTGLSIAEIREYLQVARNRTSEAIREAIPLNVEIDRMEVLLSKLDHQVANQKYAVAQSKIALEDSESVYARSQSRCKTLLAEMQQLRALGVTENSTLNGCHTVAYRGVSMADVRRALCCRLEAYKEAEATCKAQKEGMCQQRQAYAQLEQRFTSWQSQRRLLSQRLETLKARHKSQQLASETDTTVFNDADLARATELADQIEKEIRIVEAQQALGSDPAELFAHDDSAETGTEIEAEVDALLEKTSSVQ